MSATTSPRFINRGANVSTTGALRVRLQVLRVDGRSGSWRVDVAKPMQSWWEAIDGGDGFAAIDDAKAFARRWLDAVHVQGTMAPLGVERAEGPGLAKCGPSARGQVAA